MAKFKIFFSVLFLLAIVLSGCGSKSKPTKTPDSPIQSPIATPEQAATTVPTEVVVPLPKPPEGKVTVAGTIYLEVEGQPLQPLAGARVYLGKVYVSEDGSQRIAGYSERTSPWSITDPQGRFIVQEAPPDTYNLVVVRYLDPVFMDDYETGESLVFTVEAGEVLDLGEIRYPATQ